MHFVPAQSFGAGRQGKRSPVYPFRGIRCGRTEARHNQSDRTGNTGYWCADPERDVRKDHQQYAGVQEPWCLSDGTHYLWQV